MNKIVKYLAVALTALTLFPSCEKEEEKVEKLELISGVFTGTMTAVKGENAIYDQENVTIKLSEAGGNYIDLHLGGDYKDSNGIELPTSLRFMAVKNHDLISYRTNMLAHLNTLRRIIPAEIRKINGKVYLNITFDDAKPYTIVEFKEN